MPLFKKKSKSAPANDMAEPKPTANSLPLARSVQMQSKKKMSKGGMIKMEGRPSIDTMEDMMSMAERIRRKRMADGGMVDSDQNGIDAIKKEMYAEGGMVDLDEESEEIPNQYDKMNREAANQEQYDDDQLSAQPMDSNEHGHSEQDEHDLSLVQAIRRKLKSKI